MINEDYVSFETAKLLKEKGFRAVTNRYYNAQYNEIRTVSDTFAMNWNDEEYMRSITMPGAVAIPTLQMAMKWLREVHNICISVDVKIGGGKYYVCISSTENGLSHGVLEDEVWDTFEEACEVAIKYCLENLI